jgi:hypothetical protein
MCHAPFNQVHGVCRLLLSSREHGTICHFSHWTMDRFSNACCSMDHRRGHCPAMKTTVGVPIALLLLLVVLDLPGTTALFAIVIPRRSTFTAFVGTAGGGSWSLQKRRRQQLGSLQKHQATSSATTEAAETSKATTTVITTAKDRLESLLQPEQRPLNDKNDATATTFKQQPAAAAVAAAVLLVNVTLTKHRPLGCIVEESVALTNTLPHLVFVASVSPNGHAAKAGIQVGDVIVAMSGLFGQVESVLGQGIDIVYVKVSVLCVEKTLCHIQRPYLNVFGLTLPYGSLQTFYCIAASRWYPAVPIRNPCRCNCCGERVYCAITKRPWWNCAPIPTRPTLKRNSACSTICKGDTTMKTTVPSARSAMETMNKSVSWTIYSPCGPA